MNTSLFNTAAVALIGLALIGQCHPLEAAAPGLALAPLERGRGVRSASVSLVQGALETELSRRTDITLVERSHLEDVLKEARLQQSGVTNNKDATRLGQLLNAAYIVFGQIGHTDDRFHINLRVVDVASGQILRAETATWDGQAQRGQAIATLLAGRLAAAAVLLGPQPMVRFAGGQIQIGSTEGTLEQRPPHTVSLPPYELDRFETSALAFHNFLEKSGKRLAFPRHPERPAVGMSWHQATAFCATQGKRLPTEAEWEAAARQTPTAAVLRQPQPVHSAGTGPIHLHGNAAEWVQDWYDPTYYAASPDSAPAGPDYGDYKSYRGASWEEPGLGATSRNYHNPDRGGPHIGIRCARDAAD
jgi:formylglycine-generating enzyme